MANEGFFARLRNLWRGMFSNWISRKEEENPEAVYESAIAERLQRYEELKRAVAGIVYLRNKLASEMEQKTKELSSIQDQINLAVEKEEDEVALALIQKKDDLQADIARIQQEIETTGSEAEEAKRSLQEFQGEIQRLHREKDRVLAQIATLEARRAISRQLDKLSPEADVRALETVREKVERLAAEQDAIRETSDQDLNQKLRDIRKESTLASAKAQLEEMKKAKKEVKEPSKVEKTI